MSAATFLARKFAADIRHANVVDAVKRHDYLHKTVEGIAKALEEIDSYGLTSTANDLGYCEACDGYGERRPLSCTHTTRGFSCDCGWVPCEECRP